MDKTESLYLLSRDEIRELVSPSNFRGFLAVGTTWTMIAGSFALVAFNPSFIPSWITVLIALVVLGGRHLALAILMHDCSHYSLFKTKRLNDWIGRWLCSYPTWQDLRRYRAHHLKHHQYAGSEEDPDLSLIKGFPLTRASLIRKFLRDLTGISGIKRIYGLILMDFGFIQYTVAAEVKWTQERMGFFKRLKTGIINLHGVVITNVVLFYALNAFGHPELYALWVVSYLTTFSFFVRIRSIAEHACTEMDLDPLKNTRTTHASPLARITVAPHWVNYHLAHHLLMSVPYFKLPKFHTHLKTRHVLDAAYLAKNYGEVLKLAVR